MHNRREFFKYLGKSAFGVALASMALGAFRSTVSFAEQKLEMITDKNPMWKALEYKAKSPDKNKECDKCTLYVKVDDAKGTCMMIPGVYVGAKATCKQFNLKKA